MISRENLDRFIPNKSVTDFDFADFMLTEEYRPVVSSFWMALVPTLVELEGTSVDLDVGGKGG
ncbi:unnamed protein product [Prunus armeniaca]